MVDTLFQILVNEIPKGILSAGLYDTSVGQIVGALPLKKYSPISLLPIGKMIAVEMNIPLIYEINLEENMTLFAISSQKYQLTLLVDTLIVPSGLVTNMVLPLVQSFLLQSDATYHPIEVLTVPTDDFPEFTESADLEQREEFALFEEFQPSSNCESEASVASFRIQPKK